MVTFAIAAMIGALDQPGTEGYLAALGGKGSNMSRRTSSVIARSLVVGSCLAVLLSSFGPASASPLVQYEGVYSYVTTSRPAASGVQTANVARCPDGTVVLGGGVHTSGTSLADEVATTAPFDGRDGDRRPDDGWIGEVNTGGAPATMTTYAICAPFGGVVYPARSKDVRSGTRELAVVGCPRTHRGVGGGVRTIGTSTRTVVAESSRRLGGWRGAVNNDLAKRTTFTTHAICIRASVIGAVTITNGNQAPPGRSFLQQTCFTVDPTHAISGGGSIDGGLQGELAGLFPIDDGSDADSVRDDGWQIETNNQSSGNLSRGISVNCYP
jgi:hypothetical protein